MAPAAGDGTLGRAADTYLVILRGAGHSSTRRTYGRVLSWIVTEFGSDTTSDREPPVASAKSSMSGGGRLGSLVCAAGWPGRAAAGMVRP